MRRWEVGDAGPRMNTMTYFVALAFKNSEDARMMLAKKCL
jgi:hypothetical protein